MKSLLVIALLSLAVTSATAGGLSMYSKTSSTTKSYHSQEIKVIEIPSNYTSKDGELDWSLVTYDSQDSSFSILESVGSASKRSKDNNAQNLAHEK